MTGGMRGATTWLVAGLVACASGCGDLPEVSYERDGFSLAVEFDQPVCEGTLRGMERSIERVEERTGMHTEDPITVYWLRGDTDRICPTDVSGCFIPGTRIIAATHPSIHHELVHAVLNTRGSNPFVEEGLAELLSGAPAHHDPDLADRPLRELGRDARDVRRGGLDYDRAAHFMHFVQAEAGDAAIAELAQAIDLGLDSSRFVEILERHFALSGDQVEAEYAKTSSFYPSELMSSADEFEPVSNLLSTAFELDCDAADTMGPISDEQPGMYQVHRLAATRRLHGTLTLAAEAGIDGVLFRQTDALHRWSQEWWYPLPGADEERIVLRAGVPVDVDLRPEAGWLIMIRKRASTSTGRAWLLFVDADDDGFPTTPDPQANEQAG